MTRGELADAKSTTDKVEDVRGRRGWKRIFSSLGKFSSETSGGCGHLSRYFPQIAD